MPLVSSIPKKAIINQYQTIKMLEEKCKCCKLLAGKQPEMTFIFSVSNPIWPKYDTMVAISKYAKTYAMCAPDYLSDAEMVVFEFVLRDLDPDEEIIVFSVKDYNAVRKYLDGRKNKVRLCR